MDLDSGGNLSIVGDLHLDNGDRVVWGTSDTAFIQGDESMLSINTQVASFISICIATYISLVLSITKYLKLSEKKEAIVNLRDKFSSLHNT